MEWCFLPGLTTKRLEITHCGFPVGSPTENRTNEVWFICSRESNEMCENGIFAWRRRFTTIQRHSRNIQG
ncbi:hypothetical protein K435DRAFT_777579 [Dendrothele bispora CBS 962.96]|uniref:Uncharacterized protein n=1 Tax=Dendrothele bispora (strain CBS 962.96) TaxID=1314807 RepID=A0A4S8M7K6_DENBC|nr:hypothetical protein K435DRAFT_786842 [Dendrothele bispora CBS 962.96]THU98304.1 hypothetical protein K435DRAFT_777579 [Dendrothele bispora CBS 962.96]